MDRITLNQIVVDGSTVRYEYTAQGDVGRYFKPADPFFVQYDEDMSGVPEAILAIPFLSNVLPVAWITGSVVMVKTADKCFFETMETVRQNFSTLYAGTGVSFTGGLEAGCLEDCCYEDTGKAAAFFSGGVDSYCTLIRHAEKKPDLLTVWGSDIFLDDEAGWENVKSSTLETAQIYGLKASFIKSSFRKFINYETLDRDFSKALNNIWWGGVQHGIGIAAHAAPYAWKNQIGTLYFAASYSVLDKNLIWGSMPSLEGEMRFGSCAVHHDGFELSRQDKIMEIARYREKTGMPVKLRVCWQSKGGSNCCSCEKCYRTAMGFLVSGFDPNHYNLNMDLSVENLNNIKNLIVWGSPSYVSHKFWDPIKDVAVRNKRALKKLWYFPHIKWIYKIEFTDLTNNPIRKRVERITGIKAKLKKTVPEALYRKIKH